jgi:periplasmic protein CpxP/Spy
MKGPIMEIPSEPKPAVPAPRRSLFSRQTLFAFLAGGALAGGIGAAAAAMGAGGCHMDMMLSGTASPADVSAHVDHFLKHFYVEIDATDAQKAKIGPLVQQAVTDLQPLHAQLKAAHSQFVQGLTQSSIDRGSLETAREANLQLADQASKRIVQLLADVGDVLTPAQRTSLATHLAKLHGMPHS